MKMGCYIYSFATVGVLLFVVVLSFHVNERCSTVLCLVAGWYSVVWIYHSLLTNLK